MRRMSERTTVLPAGFRPAPLRAALFLAATAAAFWLFTAFGSDSNTASEGRSLFAWVAMHWRLDPDFHFSWMMLVVSGVVIWSERDRLAAAPVRPSWLGTAVVALSLLVHVVGYRSQLPRLSLGAVVGVFWGIPLAVWGWPVARILLFPAAYALLCFWSFLITDFTMPLRLTASRLAVTLLHGIGIEAVRNGTEIFSNAGGGFRFGVDEGCSGLRSLVVTMALAAPYGYFTLKGFWKRALLFASSVPLAMVSNALRIFTIAVWAEAFGQQSAMARYHDLSGFLVFFFSMLMLIGVGNFLDRDWRAFLCSLKQKRRFRA